MTTYQSFSSHRFTWWIRLGVLCLLGWIFFIFNGGHFIRQSVVAVASLISRRSVSESQELSVLKAKVRDVEEENQMLKSVLAGRMVLPRPLVVATVRFGGGYLFLDTLFIDRGSSDGIALHNAALSDDGLVVGTVDDVGDSWSRILPFSKLGVKTVVRGGQKKDVIFELTGIGGGEMRADVPTAIRIKTGDILWWGENPAFAVGVVDRVNSAQTRQIGQVFVRQTRSLFSFIYLFIVTLPRS